MRRTCPGGNRLRAPSSQGALTCSGRSRAAGKRLRSHRAYPVGNCARWWRLKTVLCHERFAESTSKTGRTSSISCEKMIYFLGSAMVPKSQKWQTFPTMPLWKTQLFTLNCGQKYGSMLAIVPDKAHHYRLFGLLWYQQLPKIADNLRQQRSRRPGSVQPASVPSAFRQVISPGHVRESTRAGTCSLGPAIAPPP